MDINDISKKVSKELDEDIDVVKMIAQHLFLFIVDVMKDDDDTRDILLNKLFRFKLKKRFLDNKQNNYSPYDKNCKRWLNANRV